MRFSKALAPQADVRQIPWGVPALITNGQTLGDFKLPKDAFYVATLSRLVRRKRLDLVLAAAARLNRTDLHVVTMGHGPEEDKLRAQAADWAWRSAYILLA